MTLAEELKLERYKLVNDRQKYFTELAGNAFASYMKIFAALVAGGIALISAKSKLEIDPELVVPLLNYVKYLVSFLGIVAIVQISFCLWRWKGYRRAERAINQNSPKMKNLWWLFETLYALAVGSSILAVWAFVAAVSLRLGM